MLLAIEVAGAVARAPRIAYGGERTNPADQSRVAAVRAKRLERRHPPPSLASSPMRPGAGRSLLLLLWLAWEALRPGAQQLAPAAQLSLRALEISARPGVRRVDR